MASLRKLKVFEVVDPPERVQPLKNKRVLKWKRMQDGLIERYKSSLVVRLTCKLKACTMVKSLHQWQELLQFGLC
jgi:hypothetical protein